MSKPYDHPSLALKLMIVGRRRPGTTLAQHRQHIRHVHGELVLRYIAEEPAHAPQRYVQHRVVDGTFRGTPPGSDPFALGRDFVTEIWFADPGALARSRETAYYRERLQGDEDNFVDQQSVVFLPVRERLLTAPAPAPAAVVGAIKLFGLLQRADGADAAAFDDAWGGIALPGVLRHVRNTVLPRPGAPAPPLHGIDEFWLASDDAAAQALLAQWLAAVDAALVRPGLAAAGSACALLAHEDVLHAGPGFIHIEHRMNILGPDELVFGVDDTAACTQYLVDYGLQPVGVTAKGGRFEALDGTAIVLAHKDDPALPPPMPTASMLRKTVYGVADAAALTAIAEEVGRDREVRRLPDGAIETVDDAGFVLGFQRTVRKPLALPAETINAPGAPPQRPANVLAFDRDAPARPRTLSHVVLFVPDAARAEAFYARLGFVCTDRFTGVGPFLRPAGSDDHHTLFMIQTPPHMTGCEHFTFHMGGPTEVLLAGTRFVEKGYQSFWGPGRHHFGSNWFWYFNSPLGCHVEYDADMDLHDASWVAREVPMGADASQLFLFKQADKWAPGGPPPGAAGVAERH